MGDERTDDGPQWLPPTPESQPGQPQLNPQRPRQSNGKATTSLVLGILGLLLCPWVLAVLALVFGYKARKEIDEAGGRYGNRTVATAGVVLGWIGIVYAVGLTIYLADKINTPDNDGNGVPDGIDNAAIAPVLGVAARVFAAVLL